MSEVIKDGGPAFPFTPCPQQKLDNGQWDQSYDPGDSGMSLLDYFAAAALTGLLAGQYRDTASYNLSEVPRDAFKIATEMLAARQEGGGQ